MNGPISSARGALALLVVLGPAALLPAGHHAPPPLPRSDESRAAEILQRHFAVREARQGGAQSVVSFEIQASLPRLKKHGMMRGLERIGEGGRVVFSQLHFVGDELIKTAVIGRFLTAQKSGPEEGDLALAARNYRFRYRGNCDYNGRTALVFLAEPKKKRIGLFKGEVWIDRETAQPLREWGDFVRSPSLFLSRIRFVRDYEMDGALSHPRRIILTMRAALVGPAELTMWLDEPQADL